MIRRFLSRLDTELFRVFLTSLIALCVDVGVFIFLTEACSVPYLISAAVGFLLGLATNYHLSTLWAFKERAYTNAKREFLVFVLIGIAGLGLNQGILWLLTERFSFYYLASKGVAVITTFFWNYGVRKFMLFSPRSR